MTDGAASRVALQGAAVRLSFRLRVLSALLRRCSRLRIRSWGAYIQSKSSLSYNRPARAAAYLVRFGLLSGLRALCLARGLGPRHCVEVWPVYPVG